MTQFKNDVFLNSSEFPFFCVWHTHPAGSSSRIHSHEFIELVYVASGEAVHHYNGRSYRVSQGDVFVIAEGAVHYYEVSGRKPLKVCNVLFLTGLLASELKEMSKVTPFVDFFYLEPFLREATPFQPHLYLHPGECVELEEYLESFIRELNEKRMGYQIKIKAMMIDFFVYLSRCYERHLDGADPQSSQDDDAMQYICHFIRRHYAENFSVEQMSQLCGMSKGKFSSLFKKTTGTTFIDYRNEYRVELGRKLLRSGEGSIADISQQLGFEDSSFFNRMFKRYTGSTPSAYRKAGSRT
ncbi:helix-turn-helix transcriptional regulator [Paenibacillus sp. IB182496]|uniref:Helix-turn-helix transcriptional regulator n=1 Tax=Paenibacillus sabuli TaxID=2772509 RepID=A0A927BNZ5_9BACL|nr:AraC family transcriptional regulator [Paenibacillus sabuli]MBD2844062.1 helix-turn-helix transcriptional regulator [Paenibacillus sabuli]